MTSRRQHQTERCGIRVVHTGRVERARAQAPTDEDIQRLTSLFKVLGDPGRLKIIVALSGGEMCVCDLAALLCTSESAVSHQLRRLRDLDLVRSRRDGQVLYYALKDRHVEDLAREGLIHVREGAPK